MGRNIHISKRRIPKSLKIQIMREEGYRCADCGIVGKEIRTGSGGHCFVTDIPGVHLSIDHIYPKSLGGSSDRYNLQVLCVPCNLKKGSSVMPRLSASKRYISAFLRRIEMTAEDENG